MHDKHGNPVAVGDAISFKAYDGMGGGYYDAVGQSPGTTKCPGRGSSVVSRN